MLTVGGAPPWLLALVTATLWFIGHGTSAVSSVPTGCVVPSAKVAPTYSQPTDVSLTKLWYVVRLNGPDGPLEVGSVLHATLVTMEADRRVTLTGVVVTLMFTAEK